MSFDSEGYILHFVQYEPCEDYSCHEFSYIFKFFSPITRCNYILRADFHTGNVFAVKFYRKKDRKSNYRYSKIVNEGDARNILITCLKVIPLILQKHPDASFAFTASRSIDIEAGKVEDFACNQRFRIYQYLVAKKIGTKTFTHFSFKEVSSYLLVNNLSENVEETKNRLVDMFVDTYDDLHDVR